jgi:hypothetical protein
MKFLTACTVLLLLFATACDRAPRTTSAAAEYDMSQERDAYEDRVEARLDEFEYRLDGLEARMKGLEGPAYGNLRADIDELQARKEALEQKLSDLHKVSDQSWQDVKASFDRDLDQLEVAYNLVSANNTGMPVR